MLASLLLRHSAAAGAACRACPRSGEFKELEIVVLRHELWQRSFGEAHDRERFEVVAAILGSAILVPTLVATIYGANVALPAKNKWNGFIALILLIFACAGAGFLLITRLWHQQWVPAKAPMSRSWIAWTVAALALAALGGALAEIFSAT